VRSAIEKDKYNTIKYNAMQYNTIKYNKIQYNTIRETSYFFKRLALTIRCFNAVSFLNTSSILDSAVAIAISLAIGIYVAAVVVSRQKQQK